MCTPPRYLFRTFSPGSDGENSEFGFDSMAKGQGLPAATLRSFPRSRSKDMLHDHVLWRSCETRNDDYLISFSSSFLFAVQHGIRKIGKCWRTEPENCMLMIIDTTKVPEHTFSWTPSLLQSYGLTEAVHRNLRHEYHNAEYLAQFELILTPGASATTSFQMLFNKGRLFEAIPRLRRDDHNLVKTLRHIRGSFGDTKHPISKEEVDAARNLALCFGAEWTCPVMIWVLSMKHRSEDDEVLRMEFQDLWHGVLESPSRSRDDIFNPPSNVKELVEWVRQVRNIRKLRIPPDEIARDLSVLLSDLSIEGSENCSHAKTDTR